MERPSGYFRHHALFNRHLARHSGEDAGRAFHSLPSAVGGSTYAQRQRHRAARGWKNFKHEMMKPRSSSSKKPGLSGQKVAELTATALEVL